AKCAADATPLHAVYLASFKIDKYEVTNAQYAACVKAGKCPAPASATSNTRSVYYSNPAYADYPVVYVSWDDAASYCNWIGGRLPTEAEWEKAARGPADTRDYPWGDLEPSCDLANFYKGDSTGYCVYDTSAVGSYPGGASVYGIDDLAGNVMEWVSDWYQNDYYDQAGYLNPSGPAAGEFKVLRGGSWYRIPASISLALRTHLEPSYKLNYVGFRCVKDSDPSSTAVPRQTAVVSPTAQPKPTALISQVTAIPTAAATPNADSMVLIPAGQFQMGCNPADLLEECKLEELPLHTVTLNAFYIDKYEVTNARYAACVKAGACIAPTFNSSTTRNAYYNSDEYADYPVIYVSWNDAAAYCAWDGGRLPTEAEWEKAARGAVDTRKYPWGDVEPSCTTTNYFGELDEHCVGDTNQVGSYPAGVSVYGVMDMAGNVFEWVADWYANNYYTTSPEANPAGPALGDYRVIRGGSWGDVASYVRIASRYYYAPNQDNAYIGFRCARSVTP
ncbi:MAG: formylglycine-generating enzyme family protein, partial [Anaerolineae bacterium]